MVVAEQEEEKEKRLEVLGIGNLGVGNLGVGNLGVGTLGICCNARRDKIK